MDDPVIESVETWLREVVIGHDFCPFAKPALKRQQIRFSVSNAVTEDALLVDLLAAMEHLHIEKDVETTVLIVPHLFADFSVFNQFLDVVDGLLIDSGFEGVFQVATFHPDYCFADADQNDISNYTNRAPYPILHILREASVADAVDHHPNVEEIPQRNIDYLNGLSPSQQRQLKSFSKVSRLD